jgi:hypothetical protein
MQVVPNELNSSWASTWISLTMFFIVWPATSSHNLLQVVALKSWGLMGLLHLDLASIPTTHHTRKTNHTQSQAMNLATREQCTMLSASFI